MRKILLTIAIVLLALNLKAESQIPVDFDERVELVSTVFYLAGAPEYNTVMVAGYKEKVDSAFGRYRNHMAVEMAAKYRKGSGISYDAVVGFALHVTYDKGHHLMLDTTFNEGGDYSFDRLSKEQRDEFIKALDDFYVKTDFRRWYDGTEEMRNKALAAFEKISKEIDFKWFEKFFEKREEATFRIIVSIGVGTSNYGCHSEKSDGSEIMSPVIGCCHTNEQGEIAYPSETLIPTIIHEFSHSYCNALNEKHWGKMDSIGEKVFKLNKKILKRQAYTNAKTMMDETFVRAAVICYITSHYQNSDEYELVRSEEDKGFALTRTMVNSLRKRELNGRRFATMESFMPELVRDINQFNIKEYKKEKKEEAKNVVKYTCNIKSSKKEITAGRIEVKITFDRPMLEAIALGYHPEGLEFPELEGMTWNEEKTVQTIVFNLKPGMRYGFTILGKRYMGKDGSRGRKDEVIEIRTK